MKIIIPLFLAFLFPSISLFSQTVTESVNFDNFISPGNNDFANLFSNGLGLTQIQSNGVSGSGCLSVPDSNNWGNDNAHYCSKYKGIIGNSYITELYFKYDTIQIITGRFDRAASIWLAPGSDFNHYLIATISHDKRIVFYSYSWTNAPGTLISLQHGNWYQMKFTANFIGGAGSDQINAAVEIYNWGTSGGGPPIPVGTSSGTLFDNTLISDQAIDVSITGCRWGGSIYLDNFSYSGVKSADSCIVPTTFNEIDSSNNGLEISIQNHFISVSNKNVNKETVISIYTINGQLLDIKHFTSISNSIPLEGFKDGIYFISVKNRIGQLNKKFVIAR